MHDGMHRAVNVALRVEGPTQLQNRRVFRSARHQVTTEDRTVQCEARLLPRTLYGQRMMGPEWDVC
jgi:hypothetical protein